MILGSQKKTLSGFSSTAILPHTGYVYYSDVVQGTPLVSRNNSDVSEWLNVNTLYP